MKSLHGANKEDKKIKMSIFSKMFENVSHSSIRKMVISKWSGPRKGTKQKHLI